MDLLSGKIFIMKDRAIISNIVFVLFVIRFIQQAKYSIEKFVPINNWQNLLYIIFKAWIG
jgi:hypothetical protein